MRIVLFFLLALIPLSSAQGQNYYVPGEIYTFRSLSPTDSSKTHLLRVRFDDRGNAHLRRSTEDVQSGDEPMLYVLAPAGEYALSQDEIEIIKNDESKYWLVPISESGQPQSLSNDAKTVVFWCDCPEETSPGSVVNFTDFGAKIRCYCRQTVTGGDDASRSGKRRKKDKPFAYAKDLLRENWAIQSGCKGCRMSIRMEERMPALLGGAVLLKASSLTWE